MRIRGRRDVGQDAIFGEVQRLWFQRRTLLGSQTSCVCSKLNLPSRYWIINRNDSNNSSCTTMQCLPSPGSTLPNHVHTSPQPIKSLSQLLLAIRTLRSRLKILHPTLRAGPKVCLLKHLVQRKRASRRICVKHVVRPLHLCDGVARQGGADVVSFGPLGIGMKMLPFRGG